MTDSKTEITCFPFFRVLVSFSAELQPFRSNRRASSPLPRLIFLLCFTCKTRCCRPLEREGKNEEEKKKTENVQEKQK